MSVMQRLEKLTGLKARWLVSLFAAIVFLAVIAGAWEITVYDREGALLRADPDAVAADGRLMAFAMPRGAAIFSSHCATCHGAAAKGDSVLGVPDLADRDWLYGFGRVSDIQQTVLYGIRSHDPRGRDLADMPAFSRPEPYAKEKLPSLAPADIEDIIAYLFTLEGRAADVAAAARGNAIYHTRGACWDCHGQDAHGDSAIGAPNLTDKIWLYGRGSHDEVFASIADGHAGVCPAWIGRLSAAEILEVSLYVHALSQGGS